jgi:thioredoxin-dependent peroxiredoxin
VDKTVCKAFGVLKEKSMYGRKVIGIARTTFVIDGNGDIAKTFENVKPDGHAEEVLAALKA